VQALISRGITRLIRTGSNPIYREAPALPTFPETDRLFFLSPHLLVGDVGTGKTTLLYWLAWQLAASEERVPFYLNLRHLGRRVTDQALSKKFREVYDPWMPTQGRTTLFAELRDTGRLVFLLDGLDQMPAANYPAVLEELLPIVKGGKNNGLLLATRRTPAPGPGGSPGIDLPAIEALGPGRAKGLFWGLLSGGPEPGFHGPGFGRGSHAGLSDTGTTDLSQAPLCADSHRSIPEIYRLRLQSGGKPGPEEKSTTGKEHLTGPGRLPSLNWTPSSSRSSLISSSIDDNGNSILADDLGTDMLFSS